jgi:predicted  nucleic acid-binding Zn-ribbon protein
MHQTEYKEWLKGIVDSVEELETSYKRRIDIMTKEYQRDIADLLSAYKAEKNTLNTRILKLEYELEIATNKFKEAQRQFKTEKVAHNITKDNLNILQQKSGNC